jgi:hypothetical protein
MANSIDISYSQCSDYRVDALRIQIKESNWVRKNLKYMRKIVVFTMVSLDGVMQ